MDVYAPVWKDQAQSCYEPEFLFTIPEIVIALIRAQYSKFHQPTPYLPCATGSVADNKR